MRSPLLLVVLLVLLPFIVARSNSRLRFSDEPRETVAESSPLADVATGNPISFITTTPTSAPHVAPTSTPLSPPSPPSPPTPWIPSTPDAWVIRYLPPSYVLTSKNASASGTVQSRTFSVAATTAKLASHLTSHEVAHQQKRLDRYVDRLQRRALPHNVSYGSDSSATYTSSHHGGGHHGGGHHYRELSSFYLRHVQCRACVQPNLDLLHSTQRVALPSYQPYAMMKFCHNAEPQMAHEQRPSASNPNPLQDWEGVCVPAQAACPSNTVDLNTLSTSTCANDAAITKQSCALCVLDGYTWATHRRAMKGGDNYDGRCVASLAGWEGGHHSVLVGQLDDCPSVAASQRDQMRLHQVSGSFFIFFAFTAGLCCCLALRRCCQARAKTRAARLAAAQAHMGVEVPVAEPVSVGVSVSASQPVASSYPGRVAAAQAQVREARQQAVAMQEPLLVSSGLNPPFYPQVSGPPAYGYAYRM